MAHTIYRREDQVVDVRRLENGGAAIRAVRGSRRLGEVEVPPRLVNQWLERAPGFVDRARRVDLAVLLQRLRPRPGAKSCPERTIERLVLSIPDLELSGLPWETWLDELWIRTCPAARRPVVVRVSPVRFPLAETPLTLPLRFLEVTTRQPRAPAEELAATVQSVFGGHDPARVARAVRIESTSPEELAGFELSDPRFPVGVVHLWEPRFPKDATGLTRTITPKEPGSLGWVLHWTRELRCRLIVCVCRDAGAAVQARRLGAAVVARGGPAVLVLPGEPAQSGVLARFYSFLIHNHPLDHAAELARDHPQTLSLFVGGGREEALRLTRLGEELSGLAADLIVTPLSGMAGDPRIRRLRRLLGADLHAGVSRAALHRETLQRFVEDWPKLKFEEHEGEGLLPLTDHVGALQQSVFTRRLARVRPPPREPPSPSPPKAFASAPGQPPRAGGAGQATGSGAVTARLAGTSAATPAPRVERYVNTAVWAEGEQDRLEPLEPVSARLSPRRTYHLEVAIGPSDRRMPTLGAAPLPEDTLQWRPDVDGVPLEVAVTGLDCTILGDPVRTLWLPRAGRSESLFFAFRPGTRPVVRLRVCVYHRQNLVQSFRVAFLTRMPGRPEPRPAARRRLLAQALDLPSPTATKARRKPLGKRPARTRSPRTAAVPDVGILSRLEYSLGQAEGQWASRPDRTLSIVANDLDGQAVITVKGADVFGVAAPGDLSDYVAGLRTALRDLGIRKFATGEQYRFGLAGDPNRGKPEDLQEGLKTLAELGRELYVQLFSDARLQQAIEQSLAEPGTIHVAHVLVEKVLPWSLLYDREYDANKETDASGNPVGHVVCTAALGEPPDSAVKLQCGQHPDCPLHPDRVKARATAGEPVLLPETVVCPRHFWGFRHLIELPAQQAGPTGTPPPAQQDQILSGQTLNVVAAFHEGLALVQEHAASLEQLFAPPRAALRRAAQRDTVMTLLDDPQLDLAYFYCHARGGEAEGAASRGFLEVQAGGQARPGKIAPGDFRRVEWIHHPMVIINGCHSAGFSPRALSPFVRVFMGRQASGVIGTEVDVWEELAGEFVRLFAAEFLRGTPAGQALRQARLALLARNNPLGLAYTLYAASQLALPKPGEPV